LRSLLYLKTGFYLGGRLATPPVHNLYDSQVRVNGLIVSYGLGRPLDNAQPIDCEHVIGHSKLAVPAPQFGVPATIGSAGDLI